jgi:hypothetical protein
MDPMHDLRRAPLALAMLALVLALLLPAASASAATPPWGKGMSRGEDLEITLVTFSPGDPVPSWFGHSAIGVRDHRLKREVIYNYGTFAFSDALVPQFLMGRLEFWVSAGSYQGTLRAYAARDRDVRIATLNIPPDARLKIAEFLVENVKPENRVYLYHHYYDNCSTRLRDIIDEATGGQLEAAAKATPSDMTLRGHTRRHATWRVLEFGMSYLMGPEIDKDISVWETMFLPGELEKFARGFTYTNASGEEVPIFSKEVVFYEAKERAPTPAEPQLLAPWLFLIGALFGGLAYLLRARYDKAPAGSRARRVLFGLYHAAMGLGIGGAGTIVALMWAFTDHTVVYGNHNVSLTNPLALAAVPLGLAFAFGKTGAGRWLERVWQACVVIAALGLIAKLVLPTHDNLLTYSIMAPTLAGALASVFGLGEAVSPTPREDAEGDEVDGEA